MQFIKTYKNALTNTIIEELIDHSKDDDKFIHLGEHQFDTGGLGRKDYQKFLRDSHPGLFIECQRQLQPLLSNYVSQYPALQDSMFSNEIKLQRTPLTGGYSVWHAEQNPGPPSNRALAWLVYLNDIEEGGETEFLYQKHRQKAEKGTLVVWPAGFTHVHRGNPPLSEEKFVLTGWGTLYSSIAASYIMENKDV